MRDIDLTRDGVLRGDQDTDRINTLRSFSRKNQTIRKIFYGGYTLPDEPTFVEILFNDRGPVDPYHEVLHGKVGCCYECGSAMQPWDYGIVLGDVCNDCYSKPFVDTEYQILYGNLRTDTRNQEDFR